MGQHTTALWNLGTELFTADMQAELRSITAASCPTLPDVITLDMHLGGPSFTTVNQGNTGRYAGPDRDVFRPFQYCTAHFERMLGDEGDEWVSRDIVEMSSLHLEALVKRIGSAMGLPLGQALRKAIAKRRIDPTTWSQLDRYTRIYNAAKHCFDHDKDTHMFSVEDALLAYFVCRVLGAQLYHLANLATDLRVFDEC
ncbi:MAG: hypothetical protein ACYDBB_02400 [Armatimonadota bacterium]